MQCKHACDADISLVSLTHCDDDPDHILPQEVVDLVDDHKDHGGDDRHGHLLTARGGGLHTEVVQLWCMGQVRLAELE